MAPRDADVSGPAPALKENFPTGGRQSLLPAQHFLVPLKLS